MLHTGGGGRRPSVIVMVASGEWRVPTPTPTPTQAE